MFNSSSTWQDPRKNKPAINWQLISAVGAIIAFCTAFYYIGRDTMTNKYDREKLELKSDLEQCKNEIVRLQHKLRVDSVNRENWISNRLADVCINEMREDMLTLTVSNLSTGPCDAGSVNSCWAPQIDARVGDSIAFHIYYNNCGTNVLPNVSVGIFPMHKAPTSRSLSIMAGIAIDGYPIKLGTALINFEESNIKLEYIKGSISWYQKRNLKSIGIINEMDLFTNFGLPIGDILPGLENQGAIILSYRVEKAK